MRKWWPLALLGLGSLGVLLFSERGRQSLMSFEETMDESPEALVEWEDAVLAELDRIQSTLNKVAGSLAR